MLKYSLIVLFSFFSFLLHAHSIVFVHIGPHLPNYLPIAIEQARLFNKNCPIYLIANRAAFKEAPFTLDTTVECVPCETLVCSHSHTRFRTHSTLNRNTFEGFWLFTSERFFYLEELMRQYELKDVFHLENDVMLYTDLSKFLPFFQQHYAGKIGATFDNDTRCIPGFVYISESKPLSMLADMMAARASAAQNDMEMLQEFKNKYDHFYIDHLPIVIPEYSRDRSLKTAQGTTTKQPDRYSQHFALFQSIFDAAAIGQYLGGISPRNGEAISGFINESCLFNPALFTYHWQQDSEGRLIPFIRYQEAEYPINNLHIHSKNLHLFSSRRSMTKNGG